jgi:SAM-dependent methyltransferase
MKPIIQRRKDCRACGDRDLELVFCLEPSPIGDAYVTADQLGTAQPSYPIDLYMCRSCGLAQLIDVIDPDVLYGDYIYVTGSSMGLQEHFASYASSVIARCGLADGSFVVDLGSNDGTLLRQFQNRGMRVLGIEPAAHIAAAATAAGIETVASFFSPALAEQLAAERGRARLMTANNVFANIDDLLSWVEGVRTLLADDGVFVFESYYLADLIQNVVFDFIYHEHLSAFSVKPMQALFARAGLELACVDRVATKGGSLRYYVQRPGGPLRHDGTVAALLAHEEAIGLYRKETFDAFSARVAALKTATREYLEQCRRDRKRIAGFGASITGTTLIYHFGIGEYLEYLVDDNPAKQGRFSPGLHLPVFPTAAIYEKKPDVVVVLAWRFAAPFMSSHQRFRAGGGRFVIPVPEFQVL